MNFLEKRQSGSWTACLLGGLVLGSGAAWSQADSLVGQIPRAGASVPSQSVRTSTRDVAFAEAATSQAATAEKTSVRSEKKSDDVKSTPADSGKTKPEPAQTDLAKSSDEQPTGQSAVSSTESSTNKHPPNKKAPDKRLPEKKPGEKQAIEKKTTEKKAAEKRAADKGALEKFGAKGLASESDQEALALAFASHHHPELATLIAPLKTSNLKEYQRAVRELFRTSERLAGIKQRDPARHELELEQWTLNSQVRLLAARLVMEPGPELEEQLRNALRKRAANRVRLLEYEQETLRNRLAQIGRDLEQSQQSIDTIVDQEYERLVKRNSREKSSPPKMKKDRKPAAPLASPQPAT